MTTTPRSELDVMQQILDLLLELDEPARDRAMSWVVRRLTWERTTSMAAAQRALEAEERKRFDEERRQFEEERDAPWN